ncbi:unnamed protein product [Knipowitschia caucasica]|uniref:Uncharacterized protein n=1 Tax=Knipowitschia caucasica TaxID=637954 RepID=A0AAV2KV01_KNICA
MLDPSSSEDSGGESECELVPEPSAPAPRKASCSAVKRGSSSGSSGSSGRTVHKRTPACAPAPGAPGAAGAPGPPGNCAPTAEEEEQKERDRQIREEEERKIKVQIYVFVLRCIAYPFNAKQPTDMARRQQKVSVCAQ